MRGYPAQARTFDSKAEAQRWVHEIESQMSRHVFVSMREAESTTFRDALARYLAEITPTKKSAHAEGNRIRQLQRTWLADLNLTEVRGANLSRYRDERLVDVKPDTVRLDLMLISGVFKTARREWGMDGLVNPVSNVRVPSVSRGRERRLEDDEEEKLLAACEASSLVWLRPLVQLAIETAMRQGELLNLQRRDIDLKKQIAIARDTKNSETRGVPLSSKAVRIFGELPASNDERVFPISQDQITHAFDKARSVAGIENLRFHDLRHEATSRFFELGLDLMEVATITGHKTLQMLKRYTHLQAHKLAAKLG